MAPLILVNDNIPSHAGMRGVARYYRHAIDGIVAYYGSQVVVFSHITRDYGPARHIRAVRFKGSEQLGLHDKQAGLVARRVQPRVIYNPWFSNLRTNAAQVYVIYDVIYELFPQYHSRRQVPLRDLDRERRRCVEDGDALIAISDSTARDIARVYPRVDGDKIKVVYPGVDPFFFERGNAAREPSGRPYLLYVGFRTGHKNFLRLLAAYGVSGVARALDLRVISRAPFGREELECIKKYDLERSVRLRQDASESELRGSYAGAAAFVYPSEYEGFGLPILEALASGTLVVTSNVSSMPEVGGDAALYFDPYDVESMAAALRRVAGLPNEERESRVALGIAHARTFTWERCQRKTIDVLRGLL